MIQYTNVDKDLNLIYDKVEKTYSKLELLKKFEDFIAASEFIVKSWVNTNHVPYEVIISKGGREYRLFVFLKNITGAGWSNKPAIKRVQVTNVRKVNIDNYVSTTDNETLMILGYYNFDDNPIMVAWNAYRYVSHVTNRSCYIDIENLINGYKNGFYSTIYAEQKVQVFKPEYFEVFLKNYIENNKV